MDVLSIRHFSEAGTILNAVDCLAGRVSVLRSDHDECIDDYTRLLCGYKPRGNYVMTADKKPYTFKKPIVVGVTADSLIKGEAVRDFLVQSGITEQAANKILKSYSLERCAEMLLEELSPCTRRRVLLLNAMFDQSDRIVILHDPFSALDAEWHDEFAQIVAAFATHHSKIVIVTKLGKLPECWTDNPQIEHLDLDHSPKEPGKAPDEPVEEEAEDPPEEIPEDVEAESSPDDSVEQSEQAEEQPAEAFEVVFDPTVSLTAGRPEGVADPNEGAPEGLMISTARRVRWRLILLLAGLAIGLTILALLNIKL